MKKLFLFNILFWGVLCLQSANLFGSSVTMDEKEIDLNLIWISMPYSSKGLSELPGPREGFNYNGKYLYTEIPKSWILLNKDVPIIVNIHWCVLSEDDQDRIKSIYSDLQSEYINAGFNIEFTEFKIEGDRFFQSMIDAGAHAGVLSDYLRLLIYFEKFVKSPTNRTYVYADFDIEPFSFKSLLQSDRTYTEFPLNTFVSFLGENSFLSIPFEVIYFDTFRRYFEVDKKRFTQTLEEDKKNISKHFEPLDSIFYTAVRDCNFDSQLPEDFVAESAEDLNITSLDHATWR